MYLPQFHRTEENDRLWGEGFTDWTAVRSAEKLFEGHDQPRVPYGRNYYDLLERGTMEWQWSLAQKYGISGFCFYHYYFGNGRMALNTPAENLLKWDDLPMRFCMSWANESWTASWSRLKNTNSWYKGEESGQGAAEEMLIEQEYGGPDEWKAHFDYLLPFFKDSRYITMNGCPVFLIHRPELVPNLSEMIGCWREEALRCGLPGLYLIGTGSVPAEGIFDACLLPAPLTGIPFEKEDQDLRIFDTEEVWRRLVKAEGIPGTRTYFGAFAGYDDSPRRGRNGIVLAGNSAKVFRKYLPQLLRKNLIAGNAFQFLNAWNEWGEGNYLEPDETNGYGFLEAVRDTLDSGDWLTEKEYALRDFVRNQRKLIGKNVYLYGTGANAGAVIARFDSVFHFAGVIDENKAGTVFCGKPVLSIEEAALRAIDAVILAAQTSSVFEIMKKHGNALRALGVPLLDLYSNDAARILDEIAAQPVVRTRDYEERILLSDAVSFDLMDTLLKRDFFSPDVPFISGRIADLYAFAVRNGKEVLFTADDSLPPAAQLGALKEAGIPVENAVFEADYGRNKLNGLYRIIQNMYPGKKILHIGNDLLADVIAPRIWGLDSLGAGGEWNRETAISGGKTLDAGAFADKDRLKEMIVSHDTICFDVFDTLITRLCPEPEDVFSMMEETMSGKYGMPADGFAAVRIHAQEKVPAGAIRDIYEVIRQETGAGEAAVNEAMEYEIRLEKMLTIPRQPVAALLAEAKNAGKRIILVSDMYLPAGILGEILASNGITDYDELIVSCDHLKTKREGLLDTVCLRAGESVLFIGDSEENDILPAREKGFETFRLPSAPELWRKNSGMDPVSGKAPAKEKVLWGTAAAYAFNDPFGPDKENVLSAFLAAGLTAYTAWLACCGKLRDLDGMIFLSRDGRYFKEVYDHVSGMAEPALPPSCYLWISRKAAIGLIADKADLAKTFLYTGEEGSADIFTASKNAAAQRQFFYRMLGETGLAIGKNYGVFDFFSGGTIQSVLALTAPFSTAGLYYAVNEENVHSRVAAEACAQEQAALLQASLPEIESFICAGERSVKMYSREGPVFMDDPVGSDERAANAAEAAKRVFDIFGRAALTETVWRTAKETASELLGIIMTAKTD